MRPTKEEGNGSVTLEKLARLAKVSISTVSRALNDHPSISSSTKKQLWALARDHHRDTARARTTAAVVASVLPRIARQHR
jgi:DNA-binding LacI/PurR family transcriptional regulator